MRKPGMKRFILLTLLAALPVLLLVAFYIIRDPFHVIKPYRGKIYNPGDTISLTINWGYVTIESYKYFNPEGQFDSFIFGSSLSGYYLIKDWKTHLPDDARPFHFNASRETLYGILNKLYYLGSHKVKIKHALIVMEDEMLMRRPLDADVLFVQHPQTAPEVSWWKFHQLYFNAYRHPELVAYLLCPGPMTQTVLDKGYATTDISDRDESINEGSYHLADSLIANDPDAFFTPEHIAQYSLPPKQMPCQDKITAEVEWLLNNIARVLEHMGTDYHIIIPPHYGYEAISSSDLYTMEVIFGQGRVHDYSHDPKTSTDIHYYYDDGHLVAQECAHLMDSAYNEVTLPSPYLKH